MVQSPTLRTQVDSIRSFSWGAWKFESSERDMEVPWEAAHFPSPWYPNTRVIFVGWFLWYAISYCLPSSARSVSVAYNQRAWTELIQYWTNAVLLCFTQGKVSKSFRPQIFFSPVKISKSVCLASSLFLDPQGWCKVDAKTKSNKLMNVTAFQSYKELYKCRGWLIFTLPHTVNIQYIL